MPHVRTQLRKALIARLKAVSALTAVVSETMLLRVLQDDEFPVAAVVLTETGMPVGRGQPGSRPIKRDYTVEVRVAYQMDEDDIEDKIDAIAVDVEKTLASPSSLGIGTLTDWQYAGTGTLVGSAAAVGLAVIPIVFRCSITTMEASPETNLHP